MSLHTNRNFRAILVFIIFYISFGAYLTINQEQVIYQPFASVHGECPALASATTINHNGTRAYLKEGERGIVVLYHGNAGAACDRAIYAELIEAASYSYLLVEYAGYAGDSVSPSHERTIADVYNVIDYLSGRTDEMVILIGESLGTGVASLHASLAPPDKLLLISPYTNLTDVARRHYWYYPVRWLINDPFDNVAALSAYDRSIMLIHGVKDDLIPYRLAEKLYDSLTAPHKELVGLGAAGHNDLLAHEDFYGAIRRFLASEQIEVEE